MVDETLTQDGGLIVGRPRFPRRLLESQYFKNNVLLFAANIITGFCSYLVHPLILHLGTVTNYAAIITVVTLAQTILTPTQAISVVAAKFSSALSAEGKIGQLNHFLRRLTVLMLGVGLVGMVLWMVASPLLTRYLNLPSSIPVMVIGVWLLVAFAAPVFGGALQGLQLFNWSAPLGVLSIATRLIFTAVLMMLGFGVNGAIAAVVVSAFIGYAASAVPLRSVFRAPREHSGSFKPYMMYGLTGVVAITSNTLLFTVDIVLAGHYLQGTGAGLYDALATLGKTVLFISGSVSTAILPQAAKLHQRGESTTAVVVQSMVAMLVLSAAVEVAFIVAPTLIVGHMLGVKVLAVAPQLPWYGLAMLLFAPAQAIITYFLAVNDRLFVPIILGCSLVQGILIVERHADVAQLVQAAIAAHVLLLVSMLILFVMRERRGHRMRQAVSA